MAESEVIVVGGGVSGLAFAYRAAGAGQDVLVLEREAKLGGCVNSARHGSGFWLEMGAHTLYNSYGGVIEMIESCGIRDRITGRARVPFRLLRDGALHSIPGELSFLEIALSIPRMFGARKEEQSVEEYYSRLVGPRNYARVLSPMLAAVPSQNADGFPASMLFKRRPRRKDVLKTFTLAGGLQTLVDALASRERVETAADVAVNRVERSGASFAVCAADGRRFISRALVLAVPPSQAAKLIGETAPELAVQLDRIRTATVESVGVVVAADKLAIPPVAAIIARNDLFYSVVSRDTVPDEHYRGFAFHFAPGSTESARLERITNVLGVAQANLERVLERQVVLPSPALGHQEIVREIDRLTSGTHLSVTGNFFAGLAIEDCVARSFGEVSRLRDVA